MSPQQEYLKNTIAAAKLGHEGAIIALREICASAAGKAPPRDLVAMGECLVQIGEEATLIEISRN